MAVQLLLYMIHLTEGDTDFFDIDAGVLQKDTLAPYLFILYLDYTLWPFIDLMKKMISHFKILVEADDIS